MTDFSEATIKSLQMEARNARHHFPTNKHLLTSLVEFTDELAAMMFVTHAGEGHGSTAFIRSHAIAVATLALRLVEEGDADYPNFKGTL